MINLHVGYTATPYSNAFISNDLKTDKEGADIYPRDFIINLPSPSNYIGALRIFSDEEKIPNLINNISDYIDENIDPNKEPNGWMPPFHKITHKPKYKNNQSIPPSLENAIISFNILRN